MSCPEWVTISVTGELLHTLPLDLPHAVAQAGGTQHRPLPHHAQRAAPESVISVGTVQKLLIPQPVDHVAIAPHSAPSLESRMLSTATRWFTVSLAGLLALSVALPASAQDSTATVELRVWQHIEDPLRIYVSARPEDGSWSTLGTIPLPLDQLNRSGSFRYGDIALGVPLPGATSRDSTANVELRVWQHTANALSIYVSARPEDGSWNTLGTIPLALTGQSSSGTFRYGDITIRVPLPSGNDLTETQNLRWLKQSHPDLHRDLTTLPWVRDGVTDGEQEAVDDLLYIGGYQVNDLRSVLRLGWVRDDLTAVEEGALHWLSQVSLLTYLGHSSAQNATTIIALPWFRDGVTEIEAKTVRSLAWLGDEDDASGVDITEAIAGLRWLRDGITQTEHDLLLWLSYLEHRSVEAAVEVVDMPFLSSIELDDVLALRSLHRLAYSRDGRLDAVLTHPNVRDGITDDETTLVAATGAIRGASEVRRILGRGNARTEVVFEKTRHTPNLKISIIRTGTEPRQSTIDDIKASVEFVEGFMNRPLPVSHVIVVVDDHAVTEGYGGTNYGFAFSVLSDDEQHETPYDTFNFRSKIIHETAHFFWRGHASWIDEGVANTFEYLYGVDVGVSPGLRESPHRGTCAAHDLQMLTEWESSPGPQARQGCSYFLGQSLFQELLDTMGREEFTQSLRDLYGLALTTKEADETPGITDVREAFASQAAILEKHWADALNAPENRPFDEGVYRSHDLIQWDQHPIYNGEFVTFRGTLLGDAVLTKETMADARTGGRQNFTLASVDGHGSVGSILPRITSGRWILDDPGDVVTGDYELDGRMFTVTFRFPQALGNPSAYLVLVRGFQDGSRTPLFGSEVDVLGSAGIRVESTTTTHPSALDTPTGVSVSKVDIPLAPDDIRVTWNAVLGATWYELHHATPGTQFDFEATVSDAFYLDEWPNVLYPDSYIVRACNSAGCSQFSAVATQY